MKNKTDLTYPAKNNCRLREKKRDTRKTLNRVGVINQLVVFVAKKT